VRTDRNDRAHGQRTRGGGAALAAFLSFLPMLPSQILLNNLLYDTSQLAIPTDNVDEEQLRRPSHWDIAFIRRSMLVFGPLSSVFDFATFGVMLWVFHSGPDQSAPDGLSNHSPPRRW
jgi:P-type Mg2+ transporter